MPDGARTQRFGTLKVLWINATVLLVVLLGLLIVLRPSHVLVPDEGLYLAQADALEAGSWSVERQAPDIDREGTLSRLHPEAIVGDREIPYARHALYPLLILGPYVLGGYGATLLLSVLGAWGAALSGALIARRIRHALGVPTLWLVGIGSPVFFYAYITMAHALAAATAGFAFLMLSRWVDDKRAIGLALGVPSLLVTVLLRSEGIVYALALTGAIGLLAVWRPGRRRPDWPVVLGAAAIGCAAVATYFIDTRIDLAITGLDGYGMNPARIATRSSANPLAGAWASLFRPFAGSWTNSGIMVPLAALGTILAAVSLRLVPSRTLLPICSMLGAAAAAIGMFLDPPGLVTGLFAAFPLLLAGLLWIRRSDLADPVAKRIAVTSAVAAAGVIATLYEVGGAGEWGGRFFVVLLPVLTPLTAVGLDNLRRVLPLKESVVMAAAAALVTLALTTSGLRAQAHLRWIAEDNVEATIEFARSVGTGSEQLVLYTGLQPDGTSRMFWRWRNGTEVLHVPRVDFLYAGLRAAEEAGRDRVVVSSTSLDPGLLGLILEGGLEQLGWEVLETSTSPGGSTTLMLVGEPDGTDNQ